MNYCKDIAASSAFNKQYRFCCVSRSARRYLRENAVLPSGMMGSFWCRDTHPVDPMGGLGYNFIQFPVIIGNPIPSIICSDFDVAHLPGLRVANRCTLTPLKTFIFCRFANFSQLAVVGQVCTYMHTDLHVCNNLITL